MNSFDPALFLRLAEKLAELAEDEAWHRTSVSRAYYACFLKAREALRLRGFTFFGEIFMARARGNVLAIKFPSSLNTCPVLSKDRK